MKISIAILVTVLFVLSLRFIRVGLLRLSVKYPRIKIGENLRAAIEVMLWLVYILVAMDFLLRGKYYYSYVVYALIFIVTVFVAWFLLRDIIAGIVFRAKHNLKISSCIKAGDYSGQVKSHRLTYLKLMSADGQILRIPYSRIIHEVITEQTYQDEFEEHTLNIRVDLTTGNPIIAESQIRSVILNSPWSNLKEEPTIKFIKENESGYFFEVKLLFINMNQMKNIKMSLKEISSIHISE